MFKNYDDVLSFNKAGMDAVMQSGTKLASGMEAMTKEYMAFAGKAFEQTVEGAKAVTSCKTPVEAMQLQQKLAKDMLDASVAEGTKLAEMSTTLSKDVLEPIQACYKGAAK